MKFFESSWLEKAEKKSYDVLVAKHSIFDAVQFVGEADILCQLVQ